MIQKERTERYMKKHPERRKITKRKSDLKYMYGISLEEYNILLIKQQNRCAICGNEQAGKPLFVDHDHTTGKVRGLLCSTCNFAIGLLKDNPVLCETMAKYLREV